MDYTVVRSAEELGSVATVLDSSPQIGMDIETTGFDPHQCDIRLLQVSTPERTFVIDLFETKTMGPVLDVIKDPSKIKIGQNLKFEQKYFLLKHNTVLNPVFDTFRASSLYYNGKDYKNGLYDLFSREIGVYPKSQDMSDKGWAGNLTKEHLDYAAEDVPHLHALRTTLRKKLIDAGLAKVAAIEFAVLPPEAEAELTGFGFDKAAWLQRLEQDEAELIQVRQKLLRGLPSPNGQLALPGLDPSWNLDSSAQVLKSISQLGLKIREEDPETKHVRYVPLTSTGEIDLAPFAASYPIIKDIFRYRTVSKYVSTYGKKYFERIHPITGRIHTDFWPFTAAGRYACDLQQVPRDPAFRRCFRAAPGKTLVASDYSAVELRIVAEIAQDPALAQVFLDHKDPHRQTAAMLNNVAYDLVTKEQRQQAKPVNFGLIYGMGWRKLILYALTGYGVVLSDSQSKQYVRKFFESYAGIKTWHDVTSRDVARMHYVRTLSGRIRHFNDPDVYTEGFNTPVQGCLPATTRVLTKKGYKSIGSLWKDPNSENQVWTGSSWCTFDVLDKGFWELAELQLDDGSVLPCDTRHKVLTVTDAGYDWKIFDDLNAGDLVCTSLCSVKEFDKPTDLPEIALSSRTRNKPINNVTANTSTFWYWIGRYFGDGWIVEEDGLLAFVFGSHEREMIEECIKYWSAWNLDPGLREVTHTPAVKESTRYIVQIYSKDLVRWLTGSIGIKQATAHTKRIPDRVFSESLENRKCFMMGFVASDGYRPNPQEGNPNLHLCNRDLLLDTKLLLRTLGVESTLNGPYEYSGHMSWRLEIFYRMYMQLFKEQPIRSRIGMQAPAFLIKNFLNKYELNDRKFSYKTEASNYQLVHRLQKGGRVSVYTLDSLCADLGIILDMPIYAFHALKTKQAKGVQGQTFTLSVHDELHRFDSEGVISKNSGADALKRALRLIFDEIQKYRPQMALIHHVHDEIILEVDDNPDVIREAKRILTDCMMRALSELLKRVPSEVEVNVGKTWADVH